MATPRVDSYTATVLPLRGGIVAPSSTPAWHQALTVGQWGVIPNTANPGATLNNNAFGDMTLKPSTSELFIVAAGGHGNGDSNAATSISLTSETPTWNIRFPGSVSRPTGVTYYPDGRPSSRHTYHHTWYIGGIDCVLLAGCRFSWGPSDYATDGSMALFDLNTNDYRPRNTWPDITPNAESVAGFGIAQDGQGNIWTQNCYKFTLSTQTWSRPGTGNLMRHPTVYDPNRNRIFAMQWGDGEGQNSGLSAKELDPTTGNTVVITWSAGSASAVAQLTADTPQYAALAHNPLDGKFYFVHPGRMNTLYVVTPNSGTVWDMTTWIPGGVATPSVGPICKRMLWVPALNGFVLQHDLTQNLKFLRMA